MTYNAAISYYATRRDPNEAQRIEDSINKQRADDITAKSQAQVKKTDTQCRDIMSKFKAENATAFQEYEYAYCVKQLNPNIGRIDTSGVIIFVAFFLLCAVMLGAMLQTSRGKHG